MPWRLTPRDDRFYTMFIGAAEHLVTGSRLLSRQLKAPVDTRPEIAAQMRETEHAGDDATHAIFSAVNTTFVTPFDREDIYALAGRLDDVLDHMDAAAELVVLYRPAEIPEGVDEQVDVLCRAADLTVDAMHRLRTPQELSGYWVEINRLENEGDRIYRRAVAGLFSGDHRAMDVLKWKEVIETMEEALDGLENVANVVETVVLKHA
jgi:uncharacterized protein